MTLMLLVLFMLLGRYAAQGVFDTYELMRRIGRCQFHHI